MVNATKQTNEFGLTRAGQTVVSLLTFITAFYWDRDDESQASSKRFFELHKRMPPFIPASDTICERLKQPVLTRRRR